MAASAVWAQERSFPYQATTAVDDVDIRCGPGQRYYVTSKLKAGTGITVYRHDHGGWFMIAPPPGSFSWIDADLVDVQGDRGTVAVEPDNGQPARAIVRIGSELSDEHAYYGRQLSSGDQVRIRGRKTLQTERGPREMLQIEPPPQEFRWIKGEFVVPSDSTVREQQSNDPYQIPPQHRARLSRDLVLTEERTEQAETARSEAQAAAASQLSLLDQRYSEMMNREPREWNLDAMAAEYQQILANADEATATTIRQRLKMIESRRGVYDQFRKFVQITTETSQRDAQLASMQGVSVPQVAYGGLQTISPPTMTAEAEPTPAPTIALESDVQPRLNGAGIVRPLGIAGMPAFALVAPDGRFLAYLEPADANQLRPWIGKEAGVIGHRKFEPQLNADLIRVQRLTSVRLVQ